MTAADVGRGLRSPQHPPRVLLAHCSINSNGSYFERRRVSVDPGRPPRPPKSQVISSAPCQGCQPVVTPAADTDSRSDRVRSSLLPTASTLSESTMRTRHPSAQETSTGAVSSHPPGDQSATPDNSGGATLQLMCPMCGTLAAEVSHATHPHIGQAIHLQLARWGTYLECASCQGGVQIKRLINQPRTLTRPPRRGSA